MKSVKSYLSRIFGNKSAYELPVPTFSAIRLEKGNPVANVTWESTPVSRDCYINAKDMCTAITNDRVTKITLDQLTAWNDRIQIRMDSGRTCKYLRDISHDIFMTQWEMEELSNTRPPTGPATDINPYLRLAA